MVPIWIRLLPLLRRGRSLGRTGWGRWQPRLFRVVFALQMRLQMGRTVSHKLRKKFVDGVFE